MWTALVVAGLDVVQCVLQDACTAGEVVDEQRKRGALAPRAVAAQGDAQPRVRDLSKGNAHVGDLDVGLAFLVLRVGGGVARVRGR